MSWHKPCVGVRTCRCLPCKTIPKNKDGSVALCGNRSKNCLYTIVYIVCCLFFFTSIPTTALMTARAAAESASIHDTKASDIKYGTKKVSKIYHFLIFNEHIIAHY